MKRLYVFTIASLLGIAASAQTAFWTPTTYKGAFPVTDNTAATDWTDSWTNFDPENTVYAVPTTTVSGSITTNTTWATGTTVKLDGIVYVKNGATLTIQPGVVIRGEGQGPGGINDCLIITRGSKINAQGTAASPIVFTSNESVGNRVEGDWGGLVILGDAVINRVGGQTFIEGFENASTNNDLFYGGNNDADSSGVLSYVRIEFPGVALSSTANSEINGLTMGGVGSKTKIDHIQVSFSGDDSFEWFGGKVDAKYLVAFRGLDDDFDTDFGYRGRVQFGLIVRDKDLSDAAGDSNGFESDNDGTGTSAQPLTSAIFSNITNVGPLRDGSETLPSGEKFEKALRIRRNSSISVFNSLFTGWQKGLSVEGSATEDNFTADSAIFANNSLIGFSATTNIVTASSSFYGTFFGTDNNDSTTTIANVNWVNAFPTSLSTKPDFRLQNSSTSATGASFTNSKFAGQIIGVEEGDLLVNAVSLYPNPAQNTSVLSFELNKKSNLNISIYGITGSLIHNVKTNETIPSGVNRVEVNTESLSSGIYFISINGAAVNKTIKLIISK